MLFITRLNVFDALEDGSDASVFVSIEWAGTVKKTRLVKKPNLNETLHFHLPIDEDIRKNQSKLTDFLNDELSTKPEIIFNVWADTGKANLENLGSAKFCLSVLHSQKFDDK